MAEKNKNQPKDKIRFGNISLVQWENKNQKGKTFDSFSINKTVRRFDENDPTSFKGRLLSINGLSKVDLSLIKQAITEHEERYIKSITGLKEGA